MDGRDVLCSDHYEIAPHGLTLTRRLRQETAYSSRLSTSSRWRLFPVA